MASNPTQQKRQKERDRQALQRDKEAERRRRRDEKAQRPPGEPDALQWNCARCGAVVKRYEMQLESIVADLPPVYERFYSTGEAERRCMECGEIHPGRDFKAWHRTLAEATR